VITAPTLVLWTSHDPTADVSVGRRIADMIPGARFEVMNECGPLAGILTSNGQGHSLFSGANDATRSTSFTHGNQNPVAALRADGRRALAQKGGRGRSARRRGLRHIFGSHSSGLEAGFIAKFSINGAG